MTSILSIEFIKNTAQKARFTTTLTQKFILNVNSFDILNICIRRSSNVGFFVPIMTSFKVFK
jgi:hypothetical protein